MDNNRAVDWIDGGGVKVKGAVEVFPFRHVRGKGGLAEEVQGEFRLWEKFVPDKVWEGIRDAGKNGKEVIFKSADGMFRNIASWLKKYLKLSLGAPVCHERVKTRLFDRKSSQTLLIAPPRPAG